MHSDKMLKTKNGFKSLDRKELMETWGGLYKGPVPAHLWIQLLIDRIRNRED